MMESQTSHRKQLPHLPSISTEPVRAFFSQQASHPPPVETCYTPSPIQKPSHKKCNGHRESGAVCPSQCLGLERRYIEWNKLKGWKEVMEIAKTVYNDKPIRVHCRVFLEQLISLNCPGASPLDANVIRLESNIRNSLKNWRRKEEGDKTKEDNGYPAIPPSQKPSCIGDKGWNLPNLNTLQSLEARLSPLESRRLSPLEPQRLSSSESRGFLHSFPSIEKMTHERGLFGDKEDDDCRPAKRLRSIPVHTTQDFPQAQPPHQGDQFATLRCFHPVYESLRAPPSMYCKPNHKQEAHQKQGDPRESHYEEDEEGRRLQQQVKDCLGLHTAGDTIPPPLKAKDPRLSVNFLLA